MKQLSILIFSILVFSSCYKKKDTIARVTVLDSTGVPVGGAEVKLYYDGGDREDLEQTTSTDASGTATFNYNNLYESGQAGFAILDIDVNDITKVGIIKIEEEAATEETVSI